MKITRKELLKGVFIEVQQGSNWPTMHEETANKGSQEVNLTLKLTAQKRENS